MAYKLVITDEGEERIDEQLHYILFELENENAAKHYLDCIEKIYENIEINPYIYEQSKDKLLSMMGYHEATFSDMNYKLIYRIEENTIFVMGVFNDLQDYEKKLL